MKPLHVLLSACLVALLVFSGCGSGLNNATPEAAAKTLVKAMAAADSGTINALNKSGPGGISASRLLIDAKQRAILGSNVSDYDIIDQGKLIFLVKNKKSGQEVIRLHFMLADGRYYFIEYE